jgi:hypothetical protein
MALLTPDEPRDLLLARCFFSDLEREIVLALDAEGRPLTATGIAHRIGLPAPTTRVRLALASLMTRRIVVIAADGYEPTTRLWAEIAREHARP